MEEDVQTGLESEPQHYHPLYISEEEEEEEDVFLEEDLENPQTPEVKKSVTFEIIREYSLGEDDDKDRCGQVLRPGTACAIIGTTLIFAVAYGIIVLMDTKLSTPMDMLLAFVCAMSGLICFCIMRYCSERARRQNLRRSKHRHSIQMRRINDSERLSSSMPDKDGGDTSLDSLSRLIKKNGILNTLNAPSNKQI